jgi:hypothetical protein
MTVPRTINNDKGIAMALCLFVMAMLSGITVAALAMSRSDVIMSRNYRSGSQGLAAAEAGIMHAIQVVNNVGVINLQNDVIGPWGGSAPFGTATMTQNTSYSYSVAVADDPYHGGNNRALMTGTATGPDNSIRIVEAYVIKSDIPNAPPGAIYLATDGNTNATFNGSNFSVNGNDVNYSNGLPGTATGVPGIATRTETNAAEVRNSLSGNQNDGVQGAGYVPGNPSTPSVATTQLGPTTTQVDQMITDLLLLTHDTYTQSNFSGNQTFGTTAAPKISYFNSASGVTFGNGTVQGAGIMIVENALNLTGNLDFKGLVLVRGTTSVTQASGSAQVWGAIWTTNFGLTVGGHADIQYSSEALALANIAGGAPGSLPAPIKIYSWRDMY